MNKLQRLKSLNGRVALVAIALSACMVVAGCSEDVTEPGNALAQSNAAIDAAEEAAMRDDLAQLADLGIDISGSDAVFMLGWREQTDHREDTSALRGGAGAVAFAEPFDGDMGTMTGIDMGTVTLSGPDRDYASNQRSGPRGVRYSTRRKPAEGEPANVGFSAGAGYTFEIGGSDGFGAASIAVTAPEALISISNPAPRDGVDAGADLLIAWSGGGSGRVMVAVIAPQRSSRRGARDRGGRGRRPSRFDDGQVYREVLDSNPGQLTVSAATIQALLGASGSDRLVIQVGQAMATNVDRDGKTLVAVVRNGDRVGVIAE